MAEDSTITMVIHLPQIMERIVEVLRVVGEMWPEAVFTDGLNRLEIPADER